MKAEATRLGEALDCFGPGVLAEAPWRRWPPVRTAGWGYLRFHEGRAAPRPCYGRRALATWAERVATLWPGGEDVYVYFNNDPGACALRDARVFAALARRSGLATTRVPLPGAVHCRGSS